MTGLTKAQLVRRWVEAYPSGKTFTSRELSLDLQAKYPKLAFSSVAVGSIVSRYCSDLVTVSSDSRKDIYIYKRLSA